MRFIIARHGETDYNVEDRISGASNSPVLTENGRKHSLRLVELAKDLPSGYRPVVTLYSSSLIRAKETALPVWKHLQTSLFVDARLKEMDFGDLEGLTVEERAPQWEERKKDKLNYRPSDGESYADLIERAKGFTDKFDPNNDRCYFVVAHESINRCLIGNLLDLAHDDMVQIRQPNDVVYFLDTRTKDHFSIDLVTEERKNEWYREPTSRQTQSSPVLAK